MSEDYWDGAVWVYHADIVNDAGASGDHTYAVSPGAGNELDVLYGSFLNGDAAGRVGHVQIDDGTNLLVRLLGSITISAGHTVSFPQGKVDVDDTTGLVPAGRMTVGGTMRVLGTVEAVAVSQDSAFAIVCRIRGGLPTVTLASPASAVETVNMNQVL